MLDVLSKPAEGPNPVTGMRGIFRRSKLSRGLIAVGAFIVLAALGLAAAFVASLYRLELEAIHNRLEVPAHALTQVMEAIENSTDLTLREIAARSLARDGAATPIAQLHQFLVDSLPGRPALRRLEIYDSAGKTIASSMSAQAESRSVADEAFFKETIAGPRDRLTIGRLMADPVTQDATVVVSLPVVDAAGVPQGVAAAYLDVKHLQRIFDALPMPSGSAVVLFTREGRHLIRSPGIALDDKLLDVDFSQRASFRTFRDAGPQGTFQEFTTLAAGASRFVAGIRGANSEFVVTAGWDAAAALADWRSEARIIVAFTLIGIVITAALFVYLVAEIKRRETLLATISASERKFRALMGALPDAVMIVDQGLKIDFANPAAEKLYGFDPGGLTGLGLASLISPADRSEDAQAMLRAFANWDLSYMLQGIERIALRRDGSEFPIEISARPYETPNGRMLVSVIRDVTRRQANDRALRHSRESLARAQRVAGVGSFETDFVSGERHWSDEFLRIWGITGRPDQDAMGYLTTLVHPEDRQKFLAGRAAILAGKPAPFADFRITRLDGAQRILHNEYSADFDSSGNPIRLFGTVQDVTERKRAELELRRSRENLARAQRIANVGSFERNLMTGEVEFSDELYRIHGVMRGTPQAELENFRLLVHPEDRQRIEEYRRIAETGIPTPAIDYRIVRPDGVERVLHRECDTMFDENGRAIFLFGTLQDITERKNIENELRRSRENLARAQRIASIGSFDHDLVTNKAEWSDELHRLYGLNPASTEASVHTALRFVHPDDRDKFLSVKDQVAKGIRSASIDFRVRRADGVERIFHRQCDLSFDESGRPTRMFGTVQDITERNRVEFELRRSRENLARAQRLASIGSFYRDLVTLEAEWSEEFMRIWGIDRIPDGKMRNALLPLVHPDDREKFAAYREAALQNLPLPAIDIRIKRPDGEERIIHPEFRVTFDEAGKPIRMFGTVQDVTERHRIERELRRSRENLARAQRIAGIGSFERDLVTGKLEWSDEFLRIWGVAETPSHGTAELLLSLVHPEDRSNFMQGRDAALDGKGNYALDFRITRPDGQERILHREYGIVFDQAGRASHMFGTVQDVTERKKIELEMQRSRENLARAQRIAAIGSFERNLVTNEGEWSDELYRVLGLPNTGVVPSSEELEKLVHPADREKFHANRQAELKGQQTKPLEYRIIRPDGALRILRREVAVGSDAHGRPVHIYGTVQDITDRRVAERRERELERQLLHSQKLEALGTLAGGIAHDLNNTLVPIMALSKLTARRFEPGTLVRTNLETIYEASERARDLVRRVVAFSRKDESEKRLVDIAEIVDEALKLLRATIPSSIALETRIAPVPAIPADPSQIHQIVTNLVSNASQAIGSGIGTITVALELLAAAEESEIRLSVGDTGIGMDDLTQQRIFEPFFTTKPVGQGTGLGLSIVHGIVAGHGGRIEVSSEIGKGTRLDLYFPVSAAEAPATSSRPAA